MDASHILVGGMTAISVALLIAVEIRSRRNSVAVPEQQWESAALPEPEPPPTKRRRERRQQNSPS